MKTKITALLISFLPFAMAQQPGASGTFHFTAAQKPQSLQESATILRAVFDLQATVDEAQSTLIFSGPAEQVAAGEWALGELDRPGGEGAAHAYTLPGGDVARINFLPNVSTPQGMQELLTVIRTVADLQKIFNFTARPALVLRGKPDVVAFSEWIIDEINQPAKQGLDATPRAYGEITPFNMVARSNVLTNVSSPQGTQEVLTVLRTVADIQKVFSYTARRTLILRARQPDMDRAEWLIARLNGPPQPGTTVYSAPGADDLTRVFYLSNASPQGIQYAVTAIRTETGIRKIFYTSSPAAIVVRGPADKIEASAQLIAQKGGF